MASSDNLFIRLLISARDQASGTLERVREALSGIVGQVVAAAAGFFAFKSAIDAAAALEEQMGKLRGAVAATGGAAGLTAEEIDQMARAIDDNPMGTANLRAAATQLLTFKSVGKEVFEQTLRAAQDLSAAGFGSVQQAAVQLGKALENPRIGLGALTEVGVSFTAQQKEQINAAVLFGKTLEAQRIILAAVEGQVKGVDEAAGAGLADAVDLVSKRLNDLKEVIGGNIIGVWGQLNLQFAEFLNQAKRAGSESTILRDTLVLLGLAATAVGGAFQAAGTAIGGFFAAIATRDFSQFNAMMDEANLKWRAQAAAMAALSDRIGPTFALTADEAARLATLTGQAAAQTQQAGAAAGAAAPKIGNLAANYQQARKALEYLRAVQEGRVSAENALHQLLREEAKLTGDLSTELSVNLQTRKDEARTADQQATAAAKLSNQANRYLDMLRAQKAPNAEALAAAEKDAVAKQKQADASVAAAKAAQLYLKQARQAPQTQALATQNQQLQITLDYETRIAAIKNKNLNQADRDANNASAAEIALAKATLARLAVNDKMSAAEKKAAQESSAAYAAQAEQFAGQVQDGEKSVSLLERLRDEKIKLLKQTADEADVKAMIKADDKPARKEMAGFIAWASQQKIVIPIELRPNNFSDGSNLRSLLDGLTRGAAAQ